MPRRRRTRRVRPNARGDQSRETILDVAERHFGDRGFRGVSTAAIAEDAGISDPGLLHHYGSKEGLLRALLNQRFSLDAPKLRDGVTISTRDLLALIEGIVIENCERRAGVRLMMVLLGESISDEHPTHDHFQRRYARVRQILSQHVRDGRAAGEIRSDIVPEQLATVLIAIMDGLQLQWLLDEQVDMASAVKLFVEMIAPAIANRGGSASTSKRD